LTTNHFPHVVDSLQNQDTLLKSVDDSLKTLVQGQTQFVTPQPVRRKGKK
jgi:hypothetical protein